MADRGKLPLHSSLIATQGCSIPGSSLKHWDVIAYYIEIANEKALNCSEIWRNDKRQAIPDRFRHINAVGNASASQISSAKTTVKTEMSMHSYQDDS